MNFPNNKIFFKNLFASMKHYCFLFGNTILFTGCMATHKIVDYGHLKKHYDMRFYATHRGWENIDGCLNSIAFIYTPILFIDLPFSYATDIIMYPFDTYIEIKKANKYSNKSWEKEWEKTQKKEQEQKKMFLEQEKSFHEVYHESNKPVINPKE